MARGYAPSRGQLGDLGEGHPPLTLQTQDLWLAPSSYKPYALPPQLDRPILPPLQTSFLGSTRSHKAPLSLSYYQGLSLTANCTASTASPSG